MKVMSIAGILAVLALGSSETYGQNYPSGSPVRIISPLPAGAAGDVNARLIADRLSKRLGRQFVVVPRPGMLGTIAAGEIAKLPRNGDEIGYLVDGGLTTAPAALRAAGIPLSYEPLRDFVPIGQISTFFFSVVVTKDLPVQSVAELFEYAKQHPERKLSMGAANPTGLIVAALLKRAGLDVAIVRYDSPNGGGEPAAIGQLIGGHIQLAALANAVVIPAALDGRVSVIGAVGKERNPFFRSVLTLGEQGMPQFDELSAWDGLFVPVGTSPQVVDSLRRTLGVVLVDSDVVSAFSKVGVRVTPSTPEGLTGRIRDGLATVASIIKETGVEIISK